MRTFAFVSFACLLAACAAPQKTATTTTTTTVVSSTKPACDRSASVTGSHMMANCDRSNVQVMSGDAVGTAMRQSNPGTIQSQ